MEKLLNDLFMKNLKFPVFIGEKYDLPQIWHFGGHFEKEDGHFEWLTRTWRMILWYRMWFMNKTFWNLLFGQGTHDYVYPDARTHRRTDKATTYIAFGYQKSEFTFFFNFRRRIADFINKLFSYSRAVGSPLNQQSWAYIFAWALKASSLPQRKRPRS